MTDFPPFGSDPDTITIDDPEDMSAIPRYLGNLMGVGDITERDDGSYEAPLILTKQINVSTGKTPQMTFPEFRPLGTLVAEPNGDGTYDVDIPDTDTYDDALGDYLDKEYLLRIGVLWQVKTTCADILDSTSEDVKSIPTEENPLQDRNLTATEAFELGQQLGRLTLAEDLLDSIQEKTDTTTFNWPAEDTNDDQ